MSRVVILLGPPGAGKGTQAQRLSEELSLPHIATGDLFRENLARGTALGRRVKKYLDQGDLVPDDVVVDMLFDRLGRPDAADGFLLDGFPRTIAQAEALEDRFEAAAQRPRVTRILLDVGDEAIVARAAGRRVCRSCGSIHHLKSSPPAVPGRCDRCGGELYQREDDADAVVRQRLAVYRRETQPVVDFYAGRGALERVDGGAAPDRVFESLKSCLNGVRSRGA